MCPTCVTHLRSFVFQRISSLIPGCHICVSFLNVFVVVFFLTQKSSILGIFEGNVWFWTIICAMQQKETNRLIDWSIGFYREIKKRTTASRPVHSYHQSCPSFNFTEHNLDHVTFFWPHLQINLRKEQKLKEWQRGVCFYLWITKEIKVKNSVHFKRRSSCEDSLWEGADGLSWRRPNKQTEERDKVQSLTFVQRSHLICFHFT